MTHTLTAQDVRALRHADALCFDLRADGTGAIRAIRRAENSSTGFEETHTVPTDARCENYGPDAGPFTGFHMVMSAQVDDVARTLVRHLRAGMAVVLHWRRDNMNDLLRDAGLVCDELRIRVGKPDGRTADTFNLERAVRLDNSARMIRQARVTA